ncbi:glycosyltransferase [Pelagibacteraceae bacterium]|nr:glycosyltransferase [Pelagibacteraceae bacterium]
MKLVSIVFSFRNEEKNIKELINRVDAAFKRVENYKYELIFVNDDSNDSSEQILESLQESYKIKIINMSRNFGVGPCVLAGFKHASGDCAIYLDSDLQDPPEIIPKLLIEFENGNDVVHTVREKRLGESSAKLFFTKLAYKTINGLSEINLPIEAGDFKLISKRALQKILSQKEFRPYIRGLSVWVGYKQSFVYYTREARAYGKSKFSLFSQGPINEFINGVTSYSLKPLYVGIFLGFFSLLTSIFLIGYAIFTKFNGLAVPGTTGILIATSFFSGILLFTLGLIGIYIARIFEQTRGREKYIIKEIKDFKIK